MARAFNISVYLLIPKVWTGISKPPVFSAKADVFIVCTENYLLANLGYASFAVEAGVAYGFAAQQMVFISSIVSAQAISQ